MSIVRVLAVILAAAGFSNPVLAQGAPAAAGRTSEIGIKAGIFRLPAHLADFSPAAGIDFTVWTGSGLGLNVSVEFERQTFSSPVLYERQTRIPILASVLYRPPGKALRPYFGAGGGLYALSTKTSIAGGINHSADFYPSTELGAHGIAGVELRLFGRASVFGESRFGFVRSSVQSLTYSFGLVTAVGGVRFSVF